MADQTAIEWCDATVNAWWGCTKVSSGCQHCYDETLTNRYGHDNWGPKGTRREVKSWRSTLEKISKRAKAEGRRLRVFVQSMSDTFEGPETMGGVESVNWATVRHLQTQLFSDILGRRELDFLLLTKRPENVLPALRRHFGSTDSGAYPNKWFEKCPNVWIGTSVEDQKTADERIPHLLKIPASVRFLSCEPLLGPINLAYTCFNGADSFGQFGPNGSGDIHWVICGGESGPHARPMHPDWARSLRDQCQAASVPFFFKQWGSHGAGALTMDRGEPVFRTFRDHGQWVAKAQTWVNGGTCVDLGGKVLAKGSDFESARYPVAVVHRMDKKRAGRLLDGREWSQFPEVAV